MLRHIGYPLGRRLTITEMTSALAEERMKDKDWSGALSGFLHAHLTDKTKKQVC